MNRCDSNPRMPWSFFPEAPLHAFVERIWEGRVSYPEAEWKLLIPGSGSEVILPLSDGLTYRVDGSVDHIRLVHLLGINGGSCFMREDAGLQFLSIRFRTGSLRHFVPCGYGDVSGSCVDMRELWGSEIETIADRIRESGNREIRAELLNAFLLRKLEQHRKPDGWLDRANAQLYYGHADLRIEALAGRMGVSRRHLERSFGSAFGLSPKSHLCLCRMQQTIRDKVLSGRGWLEVALDHGYYDQAHFLHSFRDLMGRGLAECDWSAIEMSHFYNRSRTRSSKLFVQ